MEAVIGLNGRVIGLNRGMNEQTRKMLMRVLVAAAVFEVLGAAVYFGLPCALAG